MLAGANQGAAQAQGAPLRAGDRVFIRAGSDTIWSDSLPVDADGRIYIPRLGAVDLRAVPAAGIATVVRSALATLYRTADASVVPLRRVTVGGDARKPGVYYLPPETTVRDAVAIAEGASEIGRANRLVLLRDGVEVVLTRWMSTSDGAQVVASGDVLLISREPWIRRNALAVVSTLSILVTTIVAVTR